MGTWDSGLFDNDSALDAVGGSATWLRERLAALGEAEASETGAGELAAVLGLMLQFDTYALEENEEVRAQVAAAVDAQRPALGALSDEARALVEQLGRGEAKALTERRAEREGDLQRALGNYLRHVREPSLFAHPVATGVTQACVEHLADRIDRDLANGYTDMYEIGYPMGRFGMLLLIEPWQLDAARIERWRTAMRDALAAEEARGNADAKFFAECVQRAEVGFDLAQARASR